MSTLAEAKAELGHAEALIIAHPAGCIACRNHLGKCGEKAQLKASASEMRKEIRTWFAPTPDQEPLFGEEVAGT